MNLALSTLPKRDFKVPPLVCSLHWLHWILAPKKAARKGVFAWPVSSKSAAYRNLLHSVWTEQSFSWHSQKFELPGIHWYKKERSTPFRPNRRCNFNAWFSRAQRPQAFPRSRLLFATVMILKAYLCVGKGKQLRTISTSHDGRYPVVIVPLWFPRRQGVLGRWFHGGCLPCSSMEESHVDSSACLIGKA